MKLIFFDESKNDSAYCHYHLGAICIDECVLGEIEKRIQRLAGKAFGTAELSRFTEFHAADIFHRKNNFKSWPDFGKRLALLEKLIEILSLESVNLIDIQINCEKLCAGQSAEDIAFMFLCERADSFVRKHGAIGMLIGDRESDQHAARFATTLSKYRANKTDFAYGQEITNLVDSVHFTHSHLSRFLQLADVYSWLLQFQLRNRKSKDERHRALFKILQRKDINLFPAKYKEWPK